MFGTRTLWWIPGLVHIPIILLAILIQVNRYLHGTYNRQVDAILGVFVFVLYAVVTLFLGWRALLVTLVLSIVYGMVFQPVAVVIVKRLYVSDTSFRLYREEDGEELLKKTQWYNVMLRKVLTIISYIILISPFLAFVYALMLGAPPWVAVSYMLGNAGYAFIFLLPFRRWVEWIRRYSLRKQIFMAVLFLVAGTVLVNLL